MVLNAQMKEHSLRYQIRKIGEKISIATNWNNNPQRNYHLKTSVYKRAELMNQLVKIEKNSLILQYNK